MRVIVRGGGDLASGTAYKLFQCGFEVILLECEKPTSIRRYLLVKRYIMGKPV